MHGSASILPLRFDDVGYVAGGRRLLDEVSFVIDRGRRTILLGPNGAGKSLTLRLAHGLLTPTAGRIAWSAETPGRKRHAMVFQRPVLLRRSARANLRHALSLGGLGRQERRGESEAVMARFGLGHLADRSARVLSGGEQQRLAMARAWAIRPEALFLDEPTASLDPAATRAVEEMIDAFHADGVKIVMSTHDLGQARRLADEVLFLHAGRLLEQTPADEFFREPRSPAARAFLRGELLW